MQVDKSDVSVVRSNLLEVRLIEDQKMIGYIAPPLGGEQYLAFGEGNLPEMLGTYNSQDEALHAILDAYNEPEESNKIIYIDNYKARHPSNASR